MNPYQHTLQEIENGSLVADLDDKLSELIGKVKERGKAGSITVSLKIKPLDTDAESVSVVASVKVAEPTKAERASIFFTTEENSLVRNNPRQQEMKLEPVPKKKETPAPVAKAS